MEFETTLTLTSPGYPASYPPSLDCVWIVNSMFVLFFNKH